MLQGFGLGRYVPLVGIFGGVFGWLYIYFYTEGGVWNQMARDRQDMSANWAGPNGVIQAKMTARTLAAAENGEPLSDKQRQAVDAEAELVFQQHRDGIDI